MRPTADTTSITDTHLDMILAVQIAVARLGEKPLRFWWNSDIADVDGVGAGTGPGGARGRGYVCAGPGIWHTRYGRIPRSVWRASRWRIWTTKRTRGGICLRRCIRGPRRSGGSSRMAGRGRAVMGRPGLCRMSWILGSEKEL